jgi:hypothetical protein
MRPVIVKDSIGKEWLSMPLCVAGLLNPSACMRMPLCAYIWHRAYECDRQVRTIKLKKLRKGNQPRKKPANDSDKGGEAHIRLLIGWSLSFVLLSLSYMRQKPTPTKSEQSWYRWYVAQPITQQKRDQRSETRNISEVVYDHWNTQRAQPVFLVRGKHFARGYAAACRLQKHDLPT